MEIYKININSTRPFYIDKLGRVYNHNYKMLKLSAVNDSHFLAYVLDDNNKTACKHSLARLVYQTHNPEVSLAGCNIFKIRTDIDYPYQIGNLMKVSKSKMPHINGLPHKPKFYEKLSDAEYWILHTLAKSSEVKTVQIARRFGVNPQTVSKYRPFLGKKSTIDYIEIIMDSIHSFNGWQFLTEEFFRQWRLARKQRHTSEEFFSGMLEAFTSIKKEFEKALEKRQAELAFIIEDEKDRISQFQNHENKEFVRIKNQIWQELQAELDSLNFENFPINLSSFTKNKYKGNLHYSQLEYIGNAIAQAYKQAKEHVNYE
jgi:L-rhamnose mutarotase